MDSLDSKSAFTARESLASTCLFLDVLIHTIGHRMPPEIQVMEPDDDFEEIAAAESKSRPRKKPCISNVHCPPEVSHLTMADPQDEDINGSQHTSSSFAMSQNISEDSDEECSGKHDRRINVVMT